MTDKEEIDEEFDEEYEEDACSKYLEKKSDGLFSTKQVYESTPARTNYCRKCGGREFHVGSGSWLTVIKCVKCLIEIVVHDG